MNRNRVNRNRVITGFGRGVGGSIINGVLTYLNETGKTVSEEDIIMRPFPKVVVGGINHAEQRTRYRKSMIEYAGVAIFVYGNKFDSANNIALSDGMKEEFDLCIEAGVRPLPIGATGYMAEILWKEVWNSFENYYPDTSLRFKRNFENLGNKSLSTSDLIDIILDLIQDIQRG